MSNKTKQQQFNEKYITSREIAARLGVSRTAMLNARVKGMLPGSIFIEGANIYLWDRVEIEIHLISWQAKINGRRLG